MLYNNPFEIVYGRQHCCDALQSRKLLVYLWSCGALPDHGIRNQCYCCGRCHSSSQSSACAASYCCCSVSISDCTPPLRQHDGAYCFCSVAISGCSFPLRQHDGAVSIEIWIICSTRLITCCSASRCFCSPAISSFEIWIFCSYCRAARECLYAASGHDCSCFLQRVASFLASILGGSPGP
jgi:hypothetical protein